MLRTYRRSTPLLAILVAGLACNQGRTAHELQIFRMDDSKQRFESPYRQMADNAALHDMSVADIHFIPHTAEISGVGEARLNRLAKLLNTYGGTVRYETLLEDEALVEQRLAHVREYLALVGCSMERVQVAAMMSGGRGTPGDEAVGAFLKGTAKEEDGDSSSLPQFVPAVMSSSP